MELKYLKRMDDAVKEAGTDDPDAIMDVLKFVQMDPGPSIDGFIARRKNIKYYGVSSSLTGKKKRFSTLHEGFHGICGHLDIPGFLTKGGMHVDKGNFASYKMVAVTERDANIGAADQIIDTGLILEMLGYDNKEVESYRQSVAIFEETLRDYKSHFGIVICGSMPERQLQRMRDYQERLTEMRGRLEEQARDIASSGICLSKAAIAREFDVPEYIIDYKLRALEVRNYNVPSVELPSFGKVFNAWE